ncbi:MAG TPA: hypothetical protein VE398_17455 [Acidobacteriota bacterium]|nr:hypothetical protein [Acidobacteriota bacterium]
MYRTTFDAFCQVWDVFRMFMSSCGLGGRRFYTRTERIEHLEKLKERLQKEIAGIDEMIQDLKAQQAKQGV